MKFYKNSMTILGVFLVYGSGCAMDDEQAKPSPKKLTRLELQQQILAESASMQERIAESRVPSLQELILDMLAKKECQEKIVTADADTILQTINATFLQIFPYMKNYEWLYTTPNTTAPDTLYVSLLHEYLADYLGSYYPNNLCMKECNIKSGILMYGKFNTTQPGPILITVDTEKKVQAYGRRRKQIMFRDATNLNPLVYVNFVGTGTTGVAAVNSEGTLLAIGSVEGDNISLWDISAFQNNAALGPNNIIELDKLEGHPGISPIEKLMFIKDKNDNDFILSAADDKTIKIWDPSLKTVIDEQGISRRVLQNKQCLATLGSVESLSKLTTASITAWHWIPELSVLVVGRANGTIEWFHIVSFSGITKLEPSLFATITGHDASVTALKISPDNTMLMSGDGDGFIKIWDISKIASISCIATFRGHTDAIHGLELFTRSHIKRNHINILISASSDKTIKEWDITSPDNLYLINTLTGHNSAIKGLLCSQDNLVSISDDKVTVWQEATTNYTLCMRALEKVVASQWWRGLFNKRLDLSNLKKLIATLSDAEQKSLAIQYNIANEKQAES